MISYFKEYFDFYTFFICLALVSVGLMSIYSATYDINNAANFDRQLNWSLIGFVMMMVLAFLPLRTIHRLSFAFYFICLAILIIVLFFGTTIKGSKSWFGIGGIGGQPSEFAKIATILAFASYISKSDVSLSNIKNFAVALSIFAFPMLLIFLQPDLGTVIIFFLVLIPLLFWAGASFFLLLAIISPILSAFASLFGIIPYLIVIIICILLLFRFHENKFALAIAIGLTIAVGLSMHVIYERLPAYQQKRISAFVHPEMDQRGAGYNVMQSKIAIGSGGLTGKGFLKGTQTQLNYIPEQWTDFIFCVPAEEFGFIGASSILVLFLILLIHGLKIAYVSRSKFSKLAAVGIVVILTAHTLINVGMAMGIMPVIGIPLPFLSYGGSSLTSNMIMMGLLMNFYANRKEY